MEERIAQSLAEITDDGAFPNGVQVVSVIRFIRDYDYQAGLDQVADHFDLRPEDVAAAISFHSRHFNWLHPRVLEAER